MKVRVMNNQLYVDMMAALGGNATPLAMSEVYPSLKTGVVDGAENNYPTYDEYKLNEVAKYYSTTKHLIIPECLCVSKASWDALSPETQAIVRQAAIDAAVEQRKLWAEASDKAKMDVIAHGAKINEIADLAPFQEAMAPVYEKFYKDFLTSRRWSMRFARSSNPPLACTSRAPRRPAVPRPASKGLALLDAVTAAGDHAPPPQTPPLPGITDRILDGIAWLCTLIAGLALVFIVTSFGWLVWGRYVMNDTPTWVEGSALLLMSYIAFLGAAVGVRRNSHLSIDFVREIFPAVPREVMRYLSDLLVILFGGSMAWEGFGLVANNLDRMIPMINLSEAWRALPMAVSGMLFVIFAGRNIVVRLRDPMREGGSNHGPDVAVRAVLHQPFRRCAGGPRAGNRRGRVFSL